VWPKPWSGRKHRSREWVRLALLPERGRQILNLAPTNRRAALLVLEESGALTGVYCGNVVFLGETDDGDEADVPEELIASHSNSSDCSTPCADPHKW
jgi:hypothetical protein